MEEEFPIRLWTRRAGYIGLGLLFMLWAIIPFDMQAGALPRADIFYCITMILFVS